MATFVVRQLLLKLIYPLESILKTIDRSCDRRFLFGQSIRVIRNWPLERLKFVSNWIKLAYLVEEVAILTEFLEKLQLDLVLAIGGVPSGGA